MKTIANYSALATAAFAAMVVGCRTDKDILNDYEANLMRGDYAASLAEVTEKAEAGGDSEQMWRLLAAKLNYLRDDKVAAVAEFDRAEQVFARNDQTSVYAQAGTDALAMMTNDKAFAYDGGGLDREFTCIYRAIDFMSSGQSDLARVELNRAMQYQMNWLGDRRREIDAAAEKLEADIAKYESENKSQSSGRGEAVDKALADASFAGQIRSKCNFDPSVSGDLNQIAAADYMNVYALHLAGIFRWLAGDSDRNELRDAARYAGNSPTVQRDAFERSQSMAPHNQVWIYVEDGLCPCREEWRLDLPIVFIPFAGRYIQYAGMALPYLRYRLDAAHQWRVNGVEMPIAADVDKLVKGEFDVYFRGALKREITRTIVKVGVQVALGVTAENVSDRNTRLALEWSQVAAAVWAASVTAADLRSWTALPKTVRLARVERPADGRIQLQGDGQPPIEVVVPEGNTLIFVRKPSAAAPAVVKTAVFPNR